MWTFAKGKSTITWPSWWYGEEDLFGRSSRGLREAAAGHRHAALA